MSNLAKSDYLFVTGANVDAEHPYGDMDRLRTSFNPSDIIRGVIMPYRQGYVDPPIRGKQVLSGEDICYLMEAYCERMNLCGAYDKDSPFADSRDTFTRKLGVNIRAIANEIRSEVQWATFYKDFPQTAVYDVVINYWETWASANMRDVSELATPAGAFAEDNALNMANVSTMFDDLKKLTIVWTPTSQYTTGTAVGERHDRDATYPMETATNGYKSVGGSDYGEGHEHANGGWCMYQSDKTMNFQPSTFRVLTQPNRIEVWGVERYQFDTTVQGSTTTLNKYDFIKFGDGSIVNNIPTFVDTAANQKTRLLSAMSRYWSITPGFVENGTTVKVSSYAIAYDWLLETGTHTKWW